LEIGLIQKMKIVQINAIYKRASTGRNAFEMHQYFQLKGHESYVASAQHCTDSHFIQIGNPLDWKLHALLARLTGLEGYFSLTATKRLIKQLNKINPDIVYIQNIHSNFLNFGMLFDYLAKKNIATVITAIDFFFITGKCTHFYEAKCEKWKTGCNHCPQLKKDIPSWFFDKTKKMWLDKKKWLEAIPRLGIVGASDWTVGLIKESFLKNLPNVERIYNWIDLERFCSTNSCNAEKKFGLEKKTILLGVASTWNNGKGLSSFLNLASILPPQYQIVMVGKMPKNIHLPSNILNIVETDDVKELIEYYSMADVFLQMSHMETFGKVTAEALSCGTPIIALDSTSNSELITEKCGIVVSDDNPERLLEKIEQILKNDPSLQLCDCRNYAVSNFSKELCIGAYLRLFNRLLTIKQPKKG
jgi:glycosyltransferase involved in cell wall biosynthesis